MSSFPPNFSLPELTRSERATKLGIPNTPTPEHEANLAALAHAVLQPLRNHFGVPIPVSSGYRSPTLNAATPGASVTSQHSLGLAVDLDMKRGKSSVTNAALFHYIRQHLPFDQMIWEFGDKKEPAWVHVSWRPAKRRGSILRATKKNGATLYSPWTP
jgi:zinc D-Ala-D-Ala carboxypeptidase